MEITKIMAMCQEKKGFHLQRSTTGSDHIFIHFLSPTEVFLNGSWTKVKKGACIFWKSDSYQEYKSPDFVLLHNYFHVPKQTAPDFESTLQKYKLSFETAYYPNDNAIITDLIQKMEIELLRKQPFYNEMCRFHIEELMVLLTRVSCISENAADNETLKRFMALRQQLHTEFNKNWTVDDMANTVNLSPSRFYTLYRQIFGITPKKDFLQIRIEHAKKLMLQGNYSIREIAEMAGYNNQYHFIRQFHEVTGTTPGKYLKTKKGF